MIWAFCIGFYLGASLVWMIYAIRQAPFMQNFYHYPGQRFDQKTYTYKDQEISEN